MGDWWPAALFGWPAIMLAIGLSIAGVYRKIPWLLVVAAILTAPISFYVAGSPKYGWLALLMAPMLIVGAVLIKYRRPRIAWYCVAPFVAVTGWLAILVAGQ